MENTGTFLVLKIAAEYHCVRKRSSPLFRRSPTNDQYIGIKWPRPKAASRTLRSSSCSRLRVDHLGCCPSYRKTLSQQSERESYLSALILLLNSCYSCLWTDTVRTVSRLNQNVWTKSGQCEQLELLLILLNNGSLACCPTSCNWDGEHFILLFFSRTVVNYVVPCVNRGLNY